MRIRLFYGWYIVAAGFLLTAYHSALFIWGFTAFVNPIVATFGWSLTQISLASSLRGLEAGVFNPIWGAVVDRYSPKKLMLFGVIVTGLGIFCLSRTTNLVIYYAGFLIMGLCSSLAIGVLPTAVIARWFRQSLGKANGVFYMGLGIGGLLVPLVVTMIDKLGWQTALLVSAIGFWVLGIPLSFVFRNRPEDYGLLPDGKKPDAVKAKGLRPASQYNFGTTVKEALRMRAFWHLNIITLFQMVALGPVTMFAMPYLTDIGMTRSSASMVISLFTLVSLFARIPLGMLADVFKTKYVITITLGLLGIGLFVFWLLDGQSPFWLVLSFGVIFGLGISGVMVLRPPILVEYFGAKNFGTIFGLNSIASTVGMVVSAPLAGWVYDTYHDYKPVWLALVIFSVLAVVVMLTIPPASKRAPEAGVSQAVPAKINR
jgi:sugar phosphate permease